jgi:hypothetical protein
MNASEYVESLGSQKETAEVDAVLIALFFDLQLQIYYIDKGGLGKIEFNGGSKRRSVRLYLSADGVFDVVYDKKKIKAAGICQAIVLDVSTYNTLVM